MTDDLITRLVKKMHTEAKAEGRRERKKRRRPREYAGPQADGENARTPEFQEWLNDTSLL